MPTEITIGQVPRYLDERQEAWRRAAIRGLQSAGARGLQDILTRIIPTRTPQPIDRGIYRSGWHLNLTEDGCEIENSEPHAILIEDGVRAANVKIGRKMIRALAEWAIRKGMVQENGPKRGRKKRLKKESEMVAWAIAKSMQKRGIFNRGNGMGVLEELVDKYLPKYIDEEIAREVIKEGF